MKTPGIGFGPTSGVQFRIVNSVTFISDKIIIPQTSVSPNGFFGLSNGLAGNMLFIDEYSSYTDNKAASEIVNQIITTLYKTNTVGFNVATGYAGILLALSKISFTNNKTEILKQRLNNLLVEGVCTQNGKCSWSNSLSIDNNDNSFLTGSLGIIHTLKGASYTK